MAPAHFLIENILLRKFLFFPLFDGLLVVSLLQIFNSFVSLQKTPRRRALPFGRLCLVNELDGVSDHFFEPLVLGVLHFVHLLFPSAPPFPLLFPLLEL